MVEGRYDARHVIKNVEELEQEEKESNRVNATPGLEKLTQLHNGPLPRPVGPDAASSFEITRTVRGRRKFEVGSPDENSYPPRPLQKSHSSTKLRRTIRHASGTLLMMLSSSQILNAYIMEPQTLAVSIYKLTTNSNYSIY
jgi:hypothetical protein